jgi:hypothetical protein
MHVFIIAFSRRVRQFGKELGPAEFRKCSIARTISKSCRVYSAVTLFCDRRKSNSDRLFETEGNMEKELEKAQYEVENSSIRARLSHLCHHDLDEDADPDDFHDCSSGW